MKRTLLIIGGILLLCFLLLIRLLVKQNSGMESEREWFVKGVRYEFSAKVDSVYMFNKHTGKLWCSITAGKPHSHREDSLKRLFKEHDMLYLIFKQAGDSIVFIVPNGNQIARGDSVRVSSDNNTIHFFRNGKGIASDELTHTLTGYSRPFFLK